MKVELWKIYKDKYYDIKDEKYSTLFFDVLGQKETWSKDIKILFFDYDEKLGNFYYLKILEDAYDEISFDKIKRIKINYWYKNKNIKSIIETNNIFIINKKILDKFLIENDEQIIIDDLDQKTVLKSIRNNIFWKNKPNLSIVKVGFDNNKNLKGESIYLSSIKLNEILDDEANDFCGIDFETSINIPSYVSKKETSSTWTKKRYLNGVDFCMNFLEKYYPNEVNKFMELQKIDRKYIDENFERYNINNLNYINNKRKNDLEK